MLFKRQWKNKTIWDDGYHLNEYSNESLKFYFTEEVDDLINDSRKDTFKDLIFSIYKFNLKGKIPLFYLDRDHSHLERITNSDIVKINFNEELNNIPKRIDEIILWIMECIYLQIEDYGKAIGSPDPLLFFSNMDNYRLAFFSNLLLEQNLIVAEVMNSDDEVEISNIELTKKGWEFIENNIINRMESSSNVFVAMWFDPVMDNAYKAIAKALNNTGFKDVRIDRKQHNNEITSEITYEIRRSRFVIAEVTGQRHGVYFEAGYAIGKNIPVIWVCKQDDLVNVHFDTRQYNHVVWNTDEDLEIKLEERIKGTMC